MIRLLAVCAACAIPSAVLAAPPPAQATATPLDASRWELDGNAKILEHQGLPSILLDGGAATLKGFEMRDAVTLPVIASGGVCTLEHVRRLMSERIPGCIIGRALYEGSLDFAAVLTLAKGRNP